ncbi:MAG: hypothetical protein Q8L86_12635 [Vicinamibacterales bacterium]|nr:hypothetical protein [Vicinamibacterales bacterium]
MSIWLSLGALAVVDRDTMARVGGLPPWWALVGFVAIGQAVAWAGRFEADHLRPLLLTLLLWLPWLPLPVPAAFLIWLGPVTGLVWLAALVGLVVTRWPQTVTRLAALGAHPRAVPTATLLAALVYVTAAIAVAPRVPTGDEPHYLVITQSLLRDGDLRIEDNHQRGDYLEYFGGGQLRPDYLRRGVDGEIYSVHPPGVSALVLPAFALAGYGGVVVWLALLMALGGMAVWHAATLVTGDRGAGWFAWASVMLTVPIAFHAFTVYPDGPGAAIVAGAVLTLVRLEVRGATAVGRGELALVGAGLAALPWLHTRFAIAAGVLGLVILLRQWRLSDRVARAAAFLAVPVIAAAGWFAYFWVIYGTPNPAAPYGGYTQSSLAYALTGIPGLLFDQQFGLLLAAPVYAVAIAGIAPLVRRRTRLALELALVVGPYLLAVGSYAMWWGGYSAPARFAVAVLPVFGVPAAMAWHAWRGRPARTLFAVLLALSLLLVCVLSAVDRGVFLYEGRTGYAAWLDWLNRTVNMPLALPAIHRGPAATAVLVVAVWAGVVLAAVWGLARLAAARALPRGAWWASAGAALGGAVMLASTMAWMLEEAPAVNRATSQMAFLERWDPVRLEVGVRYGPLGWLDADDLPPYLTLATTVRHRAGDTDTPLLLIPYVPAGEYDVLVRSRVGLAGTLTVAMGRSEHRLDEWRLDGRPAPETGIRLTLPVKVHSLIVRGDATAVAAIDEVVLRPRAIQGGRLRGEYASRGIRSGSARVFFLDDQAFPEEGGFWTQGRVWTRVVIAPDGPVRPVVRLHGGEVATPVELRIGTWVWRGQIGPRGTEDVSLPSVTPGEAVRLSLLAEEGFLPTAFDPDSTDDRHLGVWVEVR